MPELPEVQTLVDDLKACHTIGARISKVEVHWPALLAGSETFEFKQKLAGTVIKDIRRRGKYMIWTLAADCHMVVHLRMSGRFYFAGSGEKPAKHVHLVFELEDGRRLMYHDTRKFGRFYLVHDPREVVGRLGPEPLDKNLTSRRLAKMLSRRHRRLKPLLLDQTFIAGLGNIYTDEALWEACIHPLSIACHLSARQAASLLRAIRKVLRQGLDKRGTSLGRGLNNFALLSQQAGGNASSLKVYQRADMPCPRCGTPVKRLVVSQRSTHICPRCQKLPVDLSKS